MLQEKLKESTKTSHDELEKLMFVDDIMNKTLTLDQYKQLLTINYIVHKQFEQAIFNAIGDDLATNLNLHKRQKLQALTQDIKEADININEIDFPNTIDVSFVNNEASALGAMYVLEGATLGGNVIYKKLKLNSSINQSSYQFNYYNVYQDQLMPNWISFVEQLNSLPEDQHINAINSAKQMFSKIGEIANSIKRLQFGHEIS